MDTRFVIWATGHPVAHLESAWQAWQHKQREIDRLRAEVMALREHNEHLEQQVFEAKKKIPLLKLVS